MYQSRVLATIKSNLVSEQKAKVAVGPDSAT